MSFASRSGPSEEEYATFSSSSISSSSSPSSSSSIYGAEPPGSPPSLAQQVIGDHQRLNTLYRSYTESDSPTRQSHLLALILSLVLHHKAAELYVIHPILESIQYDPMVVCNLSVEFDNMKRLMHDVLYGVDDDGEGKGLRIFKLTKAWNKHAAYEEEKVLPTIAHTLTVAEISAAAIRYHRAKQAPPNSACDPNIVTAPPQSFSPRIPVPIQELDRLFEKRMEEAGEIQKPAKNMGRMQGRSGSGGRGGTEMKSAL